MGGAERGERHEKPGGIAAAGNGDQEPCGAFETVKQAGGGIRDRIVSAGGGPCLVRNQQDRRPCSEETLAFTALEAFG